MQVNLFFLFLFNFFINSFLIFFTCVLIVETIIFALNLKDYRARYFLRMLPFFKLFFDFLNYGFSSWALFFQIDPLSVEKGTRILSVAFAVKTLPSFNIIFCLNDGKTFSIADILASFFGTNVFYFLTVVFLTGSIWGIIKFFKSYKINKREVGKICESFFQINFETKNQKIQKKILKHKVVLGVSKMIDSPCLVKGKSWMIVFPEGFEKILLLCEIEAVIAHELEHVIWRDYYFSLMLSFFKSFFWYVPKRFWQKKIEREKEYAADQRAKTDRIFLATSLQKFAMKNFSQNEAIEVFSRKELVLQRIENLLFYKKNPKVLFFQLGVLLIAAIALMFGKIFIF